MNDWQLFAILNALVHNDLIGAEQQLSQLRADMAGTRELTGRDAAYARTGADMPVLAGIANPTTRFTPAPHDYTHATEREQEAWDNRAIMDERIRALEARLAAQESGERRIEVKPSGETMPVYGSSVDIPDETTESARQRREREAKEREAPQKK